MSPSLSFNRNWLKELGSSFTVLRSRVFATLFFSQAISMLGDAFTWLGLALLSYQFGPERSSVIMATALTLRVTAFIIFSPLAGTLADRLSRKKILYITHFLRMAIVACFPFVTAEWQIYGLVFLLNVFNAFFTPTYQSVIPQVSPSGQYRQAIGLSTASFQLLGVLGPGLAGIFAVWFGPREIFYIDALTFIIAALLIVALPAAAINRNGNHAQPALTGWQDVAKGIKLLFGQPLIRFGLFIELVTSIAGAHILVNSVGYVKSGLRLTDSHYGWVMGAFGIGASVAAFTAGSLDRTKTRRVSLIAGATLLATAICFTNFVGYELMLILWVFAGLGQSFAEMPTETLIGETISKNEQGKVYGSHFAFSHLWWAFAYPIAGFAGSHYKGYDFLIGGIVSLVLLAMVLVLSNRRDRTKLKKL
ncbi:MFS transporter [Daejeonella sp. JGW-45]|uniref:MFS transporter n=1 Tax=Daejeonella sp. JGW-45 TaxID=3034148 RepID=UPI0023EDA636|nr:MFS transporter [Daejeonella sp. JGW-45]